MRKILPFIMAFLSFSSYAVERGINYDPAHSSVFTKAQAANNLQGMKDEVSKDLDAIKRNGFKTVKTFYSSLATIDGQKLFTIAELACPKGLHLLLGVYEFNPASDNCSNWCQKATEIQIQNAMASVKKYPDCIKAVAVGNEDIYNWNFTQPQANMQKRIAADVMTLKNGLAQQKVPVGSAQQDGAWLQLAKNDPNDLIGKLDFIGTNIYPFWSPQKPNEQDAQNEFTARYEAMLAVDKFKGKKIVVTEEGWPSKSSAHQNPNASLQAQKAYYQWWQGRAESDAFDSYIFTIFDKQPLNADADNYFGLCTYDRRDKVLSECD